MYKQGHVFTERLQSFKEKFSHKGVCDVFFTLFVTFITSMPLCRLATQRMMSSVHFYAGQVPPIALPPARSIPGSVFPPC